MSQQQHYVSHLTRTTYLKHRKKIREMIDFLDEEKWCDNKERLKKQYKSAKEIADAIKKTHTLKSVFEWNYTQRTMESLPIKSSSKPIKPKIKYSSKFINEKIYENCLMKAVCEIMLLAWLLCLDDELKQPKTFENNKECKNDPDFWPLYNKYSLKMCYADLHSYVQISTNLLNMKRDDKNAINIGNPKLNVNEKNPNYVDNIDDKPPISQISMNYFRGNDPKVNLNNNESKTHDTNLIEPSNVVSSNGKFTRLRNDICHGEFSNLKNDNFFPRSRNDVQFSAFILKKYFLWEIEKTFPKKSKVNNTPVASRPKQA
uniref:HEPN_Swt1 domain-containing protein n=1 Tax=Rhabditophanes sp. KR3021 TaxID=114890 RepID=A0AC35UB53_9BILA